MSASRAPRVAILFVVLLALIGGMVPRGATAATALPLPASMVAVGDSITQAASSGGSLGADYPANSWSTGTSSTVNSHYLRLQAAGATLSATNLSVSGAKMAGINAQMTTAAGIKPDYLTVLIGGNDLCTDTVAQMTSVNDFRAQFQAAMGTLTSGSSGTNVYVVSIPDVYQLWSLFKGNFWARFIWSSADICQSLLANPTSTQQADVDRRATVRQRNIDYNAVLAEVCASAAFSARCHFDGNAAFNTVLVAGDVSADYFHPSVAGQAKLASVSWSAGYTWTTPADVTMHVQNLAGSAATVNRTTWRATVTITVTDTTGALVPNATVSGSFTPGGSTSCTTSSEGTCSVNVSLNAKKVSSTTFTVTGMAGSLVYNPTQNVENSITVSRPN